MLQSIERVAEFSVARACGFAALAIFTMMTGMAWHPAMALQSGGLLTLVACLVLVMKARNALGRPYKSTELWVILPKELRPTPEIAQQLIGNVLQEVYYRFAQQAALLSTLMLLTALVLSVLGVKPNYN
jgi:hypothetical protein